MNKKWLIASSAALLSTTIAVGAFSADTIKPVGKEVTSMPNHIYNIETSIAPISVKPTTPYTKLVSSPENKEYELPKDMPDDPLLRAQMQTLFKENSFAERENYIHLPKPPIGNYKPGIQRVYLTQQELDKHLPDNGMKYPNAITGISKDKDGHYYIDVLSEPSQELIDWAQMYNKKIPGYQDALMSLAGYENMVLSQNYVNEKWWKEIRAKIEENLKAYEEWFFSGNESNIPETPTQKPNTKVKPFTYEIVNPAKIEFGAKDFIREAGGFSFWKVSDGYMLIIGRGQQGSPGYGIKIDSIEEDDTGKITINVKESYPEPDRAYVCVVTYPTIYIKINTDNPNASFTVTNQNGKEYPYYAENEFIVTATVNEIFYDPKTDIPYFLMAVPDSKDEMVGKYFEDAVRFNFNSSVSYDKIRSLKKGDKVKITYEIGGSSYYAKSVEKIS